MRRLPMVTAIVTGAFVLAACGASDGSSNSSSPAALAASPVTLSTAPSPGLGNILVDSSGRALYTPDEEAGGIVVCIDTCSAVWVPLAPATAAPIAAAGAPAPAVIVRPDGAKQVTVGGRPLYTFAHEIPGQVTAQGLADIFGSQHLTWHVVQADGTPSSSTHTVRPSSPYGDGGY